MIWIQIPSNLSEWINPPTCGWDGGVPVQAHTLDHQRRMGWFSIQQRASAPCPHCRLQCPQQRWHHNELHMCPDVRCHKVLVKRIGLLPPEFCEARVLVVPRLVVLPVDVPGHVVETLAVSNHMDDLAPVEWVHWRLGETRGRRHRLLGRHDNYDSHSQMTNLSWTLVRN